jgi:hypothetical protein
MGKNYVTKNRISGQFAWRTIEMMESPAFRVLSHSARRILDRLEIEIAHHGGNDNGKLPCTFDHFAEYGIDRHSIAPALREVEALKFIEVIERGRAGNAEYRRPNLFRLTYRPVGRKRRQRQRCCARSHARTSRRNIFQWGIAPNLSGNPPTQNPKSIVASSPLRGLVGKPTLPLYLSPRG